MANEKESEKDVDTGFGVWFTEPMQNMKTKRERIVAGLRAPTLTKYGVVRELEALMAGERARVGDIRADARADAYYRALMLVRQMAG